MSLKQRVVKNVFFYSLANYVAMGIGIIVGIATKAILGTVGSGYWALIKIFNSYGEYSDLGIRNAMIREIPRSTGAGDMEGAVRTQRNAYSFTLLASFSAAAVIGVSSFFVRDAVLKKGLLIVSALVVATQLYNFTLTALRTSKKVPLLSAVIIVNMMFVGVFTLGGAVWKGVLGLAVGSVLSTSLSFLLAWRLGNIELGLSWDAKEIKRLLTIGFPMVIVSYALVTFLGLDAMMISRMIGYQELGYYTIALMTVQQVATAGRFTQIILTPYIQERYGKTGRMDGTTALFVRTTVVLSYLLPVVIAGAVYFVPVIVEIFLPAFSEGLGAMKILSAGYYFVVVNEMSATVLYTADKQKNLIPALLAVITVAAFLNYMFIRSGFGIEGVAMATAVSYFLFFTCIFWLAFSNILEGRPLFRLFIGIIFTWIYFMVACFAIDRCIHWEGVWGSVLKFVLFLCAWAPMIVRLEKEEGLFSLVKCLITGKGATGEMVL